MERGLRRAIALIVIMAFMIPLLTPKVFAASGISITGGDSVTGGETFTITVEFTGDYIGRVDGQMTYDTDKLSYISGGSSSGNSGYVQLKKAGTGEKLSFNLKFQAISDGSTEVNVSTNEVYDLDEREMEQMSASKNINISGDAAEEEKVTETTKPEEVAETTERKGVDEKPQTEKRTNSVIILAVAAAVIVILLAVVLTLLKKGRKRRK